MARKHRATGNPKGRPRKKPEIAESRRYGPENETDEADLPVRLDMKAMNEQQLRSYAMTHYGRRFADDDSIDAMRTDLMRRADVSRYARYL